MKTIFVAVCLTIFMVVGGKFLASYVNQGDYWIIIPWMIGVIWFGVLVSTPDEKRSYRQAIDRLFRRPPR